MAGIIGPLSEKDRIFYMIEELRYDKDGQQLWCVMFPNQIFDSKKEAYEYLHQYIPNWNKCQKFTITPLVYRRKD